MRDDNLKQEVGRNHACTPFMKDRKAYYSMWFGSMSDTRCGLLPTVEVPIHHSQLQQYHSAPLWPFLKSDLHKSFKQAYQNFARGMSTQLDSHGYICQCKLTPKDYNAAHTHAILIGKCWHSWDMCYHTNTISPKVTLQQHWLGFSQDKKMYYFNYFHIWKTTPTTYPSLTGHTRWECSHQRKKAQSMKTTWTTGGM